MKKRVRNKVYKRAKIKLDLNRRLRDKRNYFEQIAEEPLLLTGIEKQVFITRQNEFCRRTDMIIEELKTEGKW